MNAIILSAGEGTRLQPLTNDKPKGMVKLFGKSLLEWQINVLKNCGIEDITIVTGYLDTKINFKNVTYKKNKNYSKTNMVETLFCASEKLTESTIISYGDIIYQQNVLQKLIDSPYDISVVVDKNWAPYWKKRFNEPLSDAESLQIDNLGNITEIGKKVSNYKQISAQYIGLMKFQGDGIKNLLNFYKHSAIKAKNGTNLLNPNYKFEQSYMTDLLQGMITSRFKIKAIEIKNGWLELDSYYDYQLYQKMEQDKTLKHFLDLDKMEL